MMKYITLDGYELIGNTYKELVNKMRQDTKMESATRLGFMAMVAKRCFDFNGTVVRTDTDEGFILDLVEAGFLVTG